MMNPRLENKADTLIGLAAGLGAGLVASFIMTEFQALLSGMNITSGVSGTPSTEKAANQVSTIVSGHPIRRSKREPAGEAVHYLVGTLSGGIYGLAAEIDPRVTAGRGAAFGVAAATLVDETLVPAIGLGDPFWKAPIASHPYSYASHIVFGMTTEATRRLLHGFLGTVRRGAATLKNRQPRPPLDTNGPDGWRALTLAILLGATAGPRTSAPIAAVTWAARLGWIDLKGSPLSVLASPKAVYVVTPLAMTEFILDKLPGTPSRTEPFGVAARAASAAVSGAALVGGRSITAAIAGAAGSVGATYLGYTIRARLSKALGKDWPVAASEDVIAFGGALLICLASLAPANTIDA